MLEIVRYGEDEYDFPCLLVLGCFDGLHVGHAELLKKAKLQAKIYGLDLGVMMFADGKGGRQLYTFEERCALLENFNVKFVLKIDFNDEFKNIQPLDFLACVEDKLNLKAYMSGKDFRFGKDKKGKSSTLKNYADDEDNSVWYMSVKDVTYGDEKISTTFIKSVLDEGKVSLAAELLGRNYSVSGTVIAGAGRGNSLLGYPTMNLRWDENKYTVKQGVYKVNCTVGEKIYAGIASYGPRPTFDEEELLLEVYAVGFNGEICDETVKVEFIDYIREIRKFDDAAALSAQISEDLKCLENEEQPVGEAAEEVAEQPVEEVVEEVAEQPVEEATEEVPEQPVEEVAEEVSEQPVEEVAEEEIEQPVEEVAEEVTEQPVEEVAEEVTEQPVEETAEEEIEQPVEEVAEEVPEQPIEEVAQEVPEQPVEEITEVVAEQPVEETAEEVAEQSVEEVAEEVAELPVEKAAEVVVEQPVEEVAEEVPEQPVEEAAEEVPEQPVEEVAEEVTEQPVEEITEVVAEQPVEEVVEEVPEQPVEESVEEVPEQSVNEVVEEVTEQEEEKEVTEVSEND